MKKGILSIFIAVIGMYFLYWYTIDLSRQYFILIESSKNTSELNPYIFTVAKTFRITSVCIGLLSLYFGVISFLKKNKVGSIGIILAFILIISSLIPFWKYLVEDATIDINLK
ncbi:Protein of unknown function (DUF3953) [Aquimarina sp. MAR_2010_214]|uniref:hypothetical protein n=1 Tax=Aquimarina sp. MAR_2010_214 TaxID=1250026 RepID=UPI000C7098C6|nr:hypothetical protein [Aquimarina sp. MAR_2010_214]PKV51846.1 Protein of unknown function (DUF3953) [Aquimarina sp. MAR_2010_214]